MAEIPQTGRMLGGLNLCTYFNKTRVCVDELSCSRHEHRCDVVVSGTVVCGERHNRLEHMHRELPVFEMINPAEGRIKREAKITKEMVDEEKRHGAAKKRKPDGARSSSTQTHGGAPNQTEVAFCVLCGEGEAAPITRWQGHQDWGDILDHATAVTNAADSDALTCPFESCEWTANVKLDKTAQEFSLWSHTYTTSHNEYYFGELSWHPP